MSPMSIMHSCSYNNYTLEAGNFEMRAKLKYKLTQVISICLINCLSSQNLHRFSLIRESS